MQSPKLLWLALAAGFVLAGCAAVFECALHQHEAIGDHVLFIGRVERMHEAPLPPLVFQGGHYHLLGEML